MKTKSLTARRAWETGDHEGEKPVTAALILSTLTLSSSEYVNVDVRGERAHHVRAATRIRNVASVCRTLLLQVADSEDSLPAVNGLSVASASVDGQAK